MKTRCPACGALASLDVLIQHEAARQLLAELFGFSGALGKLLVRYLALFRPPSRELTMDRVATLLGEILPDIKRARITRASREWPAPQEVWIGAIETVLAAKNLTLPLKSHGYLLEVIVGQANAAESKAETALEQKRAYGYSTERSAAGPVPVAAALQAPRHEKTPMPQGISEQLQQLGISRRKGNANGSE